MKLSIITGQITTRPVPALWEFPKNGGEFCKGIRSPKCLQNSGLGLKKSFDVICPDDQNYGIIEIA